MLMKTHSNRTVLLFAETKGNERDKKQRSVPHEGRLSMGNKA